MSDRGGVKRYELSPELQAVIRNIYLSGNLLAFSSGVRFDSTVILDGTMTTATGIPHLILSDASGTHIGYDDAGTGTHTIWTGATIQNKVDEADILTIDADGIDVGGRIQDVTGYVAPVGSIITYGAASAPTGWILCDGASLLRAGTYAALFAVIGTTFGSVDGTHFTVPDMRGIFPRGAGTHGTLTNANSVAFAGTLGTYQNDKMQGHYHQLVGYSNDAVRGAGTYSLFNQNNDTGDHVRSPVTDGTNGTPRTGAETNPANLGLTFIIKY